MIVDTSAILRKEPGAAGCNAARTMAQGPAMSAASLIAGADTGIVPPAAARAAIASVGQRRVGKGRRPTGSADRGCVAPTRGAALPFEGKDCARTDVRRAV